MNFLFAVCHRIFFSSSTCWLVCLIIYSHDHYRTSNRTSLHRSFDRSFDRSMKIIDWKYQQRNKNIWLFILLLSVRSIEKATITTDKTIQLYPTEWNKFCMQIIFPDFFSISKHSTLHIKLIGTLKDFVKRETLVKLPFYLLLF